MKLILKFAAPSSIELGWLSGLGLVLVERWSWVRILLDFRIFFSSTFKMIAPRACARGKVIGCVVVVVVVVVVVSRKIAISRDLGT